MSISADAASHSRGRRPSRSHPGSSTSSLTSTPSRRPWAALLDNNQPRLIRKNAIFLHGSSLLHLHHCLDQLLCIRWRERHSAPKIDIRQQTLLMGFCPVLILFVTGRLVHSAVRPVRRPHVATFVRPSLTHHTLSFILTGFSLPWAHQESGSSFRLVCAR